MSFPFDAREAMLCIKSRGAVVPGGSVIDLKATTLRGLTALWIAEEEVLHLAKPFNLALVGKFLLLRLVLDSIRKFFFNLKLTGAFLVTLLDQRHVLIKLSNDLDCGKIFAHRSYYISNCFMKLIKCFHGLGSLFGHLIQSDNATTVGFRPSVACILVELDVTKKYPESVWLGPEKYRYIQKSPIMPSELICVNNVVDSPLVSPSRDNPLKNLVCDGDRMVNINIISDGSSKNLVSSPIGMNLSNDGCDGTGNLVDANSNSIIDSLLPFEGMDVLNSLPIIDLYVFPMSNGVCINLEGGLHKDLHSFDPIDHSNWLEEFSCNIRCDWDSYGSCSNLSLDDFDLNMMNIDKIGFSMGSCFFAVWNLLCLVAVALPLGFLGCSLSSNVFYAGLCGPWYLALW
ncbi:hypothetical protein M5K25_018274 [Dendrobium thyrsiflorum]|uniref:Uncharacterized protein n=1 Tax=Dendrobium thyrsiflorum TaxID=117978 RepID=A0ABD0UHJ3_DENTH